MDQYSHSPVDTRHLNYAYNDEPFQITPAHLVRLVELNHYRLLGDKVLFGLRGVSALNPIGVWQNQLTLKEVCPDYEQLLCTLGIWDRTSNQLIVFKGSTVPHISHILNQRQKSDQRVSNILAQGLYDYLVGAHEPDNRPKEEGAFRLSRLIHVAVWRFLNDDLEPTLDACIPDDHIHAAQETETLFHSAGCQVISGYHHPPLPPSGAFQEFRVCSGQSFLPNPDEITNPYQYFLVHGRHLKAITEGFQSPRWFHGSTGWTVRLVQEALMNQGFLVSGTFNKGHVNGKTLIALYNFQKTHNLLADGIIKPSDLEVLGVSEYF